MRKILAMLLAVILTSSMMVTTQTPADLDEVRKASCQILLGFEFETNVLPMIVNGKKMSIKHQRTWEAGGSGIIVGRNLTNDKKKPKWIYWIMTAKHLFPSDYKNAVESALWIYFFSHEGYAAPVIRGGSKIWVSPTGLDVAFVGFYTSEDLPMVSVIRDLPRNLYGVKYVAIGHPYLHTPFIREGRFSCNNPDAEFGPGQIGCNSFASGMSGGGVLIMKDNRLQLAAIITAWLGREDGAERFGIATRIDGILKLLKKYKKMKYVETK